MRIDSSTPGTCHPVEKAVGKRVKDKLIFCIVSIAAYMLYIYVIAPFIGDASIDRNREYTAHDMVGVQIFVVDVFSRIILVSVTFIISMVMSWKRYHSLWPPFVSLALFFGLLYAIEERDSYCSFPSIQRFEYPTGELLAKGKIVKGTSGSSKWKSYYRSGSLQTEETYDYIGNLNSYKAYYENGNVKTIGCFYNFNTPNGIWEFYSETNKLIEKRVYKEGALVSSTRCKLKSGSLDGWLAFFDIESGKPFTGKTQKMLFILAGEIKKTVESAIRDHSNGEYIPLRFTDVALITANIRHGRIEGEVVYYRDDANQSIDSRIHCENGMPDGKEIGYHPNGVVSSERTWVKGKKEGEFHSYYPQKGELEQAGQFVNNYPDGLWTHYHRNGQVHELEMYDNDTLKSYKEFDEKGKPLNDIDYGKEDNYYYLVTPERLEAERPNHRYKDWQIIDIPTEVALGEPGYNTTLKFVAYPGDLKLNLDENMDRYKVNLQLLQQARQAQTPVRMCISGAYSNVVRSVVEATPEEVERYRCATTGKSIEESVVSSDKIAEVFGDLDSDGVDEKVTVLSEGQDASGFGRERVLYVYKQTNNKWDVWCKSTQAILSDESGGMMGDPFMSVTIKQGCIETEHYGGSRLRWGYKHRYRFQNGKCELINVTSERSEPMEFNESVDYNLSTEEVIYTYKSDKRNIRKVFIHHLKETPTIQNIGMGENIIEVPDENVSFSF